MKTEEKIMKLKESMKNITDHNSAEDKDMIDRFNAYLLGENKLESIIGRDIDIFFENFITHTYFSNYKVHRYAFFNERHVNEFLSPPMYVDLIYKQLNEEKISENTKQYLVRNNLDLQKYIDIEFFEYVDLEHSYDMSGSLKDLGGGVDLKDYKEFKELVAEEKLYFEKEKMHFKFAKCLNSNGENIYVPLYIGIGANEPLGFEEQDIKGKKRWYKVDLESERPFESKGVLECNKCKGEKKVFLEKDFGVLDTDNITETYDFNNRTFIVGALNPKYKEFDITESSNIFQGFVMYKKVPKKEGNEYRVIGEITPRYKEIVEEFDLESFLRKFSKDITQELTDLSNMIDDEYMKYFSVKWHPFLILSKYGCSKLFQNLTNKHKTIHAKGELKELFNCYTAKNVQTVIGDIDRLKSYVERLKYANFVFRYLIQNDNFFKILDNI